MADQMTERIKKTVAEDAHEVKALTEDALKSGAYLYPFKGLFYFIVHRSLWQPMISRIGPTLSLGLGVTSAMFFFTYVPQLAVLAFTSGPLAPVSAALLVLSESSTLINTLSRTFLLDEALVDTFDGTLISRGNESLVADGRQLKQGTPGSDPIARLGRLVRKPFMRLAPKALIRSLLYLPLNMIPVVGTIMYIALTGKRLGPLAHARYFQLKGWSSQQQAEWIEKNRGAYTSFGVASFLLEMIPFTSLVMAYTNTVGAALWAADIEKSQNQPPTTAPKLREQAEKAD